MTAHPVVTATLTPCPNEWCRSGVDARTVGTCEDCGGYGSRYVPNPDEEAVAKAGHNAILAECIARGDAALDELAAELTEHLTLCNAAPWTTVTDTGEVMRVEPVPGWRVQAGNVHAENVECSTQGGCPQVYRLIPVTSDSRR